MRCCCNRSFGPSDAMAALRVAGALGVAMSGSGSSVFGLVEFEARAREIATALA